MQPQRSIAEAYSDGLKQKQETERRQLEIEAIKLQNQQKQIELNQQLESQRKKNEDQSRTQNLTTRDNLIKQDIQSEEKSATTIIDEWLKAAAPRMGLYADFEKVVFASDVPITNDMIRLMTSSPLAADIAYYLGMHKFESLAISKMNLLQAARSLEQIENRLKTSVLP